MECNFFPKATGFNISFAKIDDRKKNECYKFILIFNIDLKKKFGL